MTTQAHYSGLLTGNAAHLLARLREQVECHGPKCKAVNKHHAFKRAIDSSLDFHLGRVQMIFGGHCSLDFLLHEVLRSAIIDCYDHACWPRYCQRDRIQQPDRQASRPAFIYTEWQSFKNDALGRSSPYIFMKFAQDLIQRSPQNNPPVQPPPRNSSHVITEPRITELNSDEESEYVSEDEVQNNGTRDNQSAAPTPQPGWQQPGGRKSNEYSTQPAMGYSSTSQSAWDPPPKQKQSSAQPAQSHTNQSGVQHNSQNQTSSQADQQPRYGDCTWLDNHVRNVWNQQMRHREFHNLIKSTPPWVVRIPKNVKLEKHHLGDLDAVALLLSGVEIILNEEYTVQLICMRVPRTAWLANNKGDKYIQTLKETWPKHLFRAYMHLWRWAETMSEQGKVIELLPYLEREAGIPEIKMTVDHLPGVMGPLNEALAGIIWPVVKPAETSTATATETPERRNSSNNYPSTPKVPTYPSTPQVPVSQHERKNSTNTYHSRPGRASGSWNPIPADVGSAEKSMSKPERRASIKNWPQTPNIGTRGTWDPSPADAGSAKNSTKTPERRNSTKNYPLTPNIGTRGTWDPVGADVGSDKKSASKSYPWESSNNDPSTPKRESYTWNDVGTAFGAAIGTLVTGSAKKSKGKHKRRVSIKEPSESEAIPGSWRGNW